LNSLQKHSGAINNTSSVQRVIPPPVRSPLDIRSEQLLAVLHVYPDMPLANRVKTEYLRITEAEQLPLDVLPEPVLFKAEQMFGEEPEEGAADELLRAFEEAVIREAYQGAVTDLRKAEAAGDVATIKGAQAVCAEISARLAAFGR
jgi:hypothetical protein